ncbi:MAG: antibiotic biosynthesis monooxygenase [Cyclobacteriaceae bacterium]|jgi:quinol monooxygenase YgiN|nr:antibiotic biosynthesis monooxygenase [Cytophagales bacterium]HNP77653.1 antibiotic biosynthesis monooxygenase [Cyclobacteriaceae bacterium]
MIIRIVRMHFTDASLPRFLEIFNNHKLAIRNFPGCTHLQLMKDPADPLCLTTLSHWNLATDLERYRTSELFEGVWRQVKPLFGARTQAFSLESFISVP